MDFILDALLGRDPAQLRADAARLRDIARRLEDRAGERERAAKRAGFVERLGDVAPRAYARHRAAGLDQGAAADAAALELGVPRATIAHYALKAERAAQLAARSKRDLEIVQAAAAGASNASIARRLDLSAAQVGRIIRKALADRSRAAASAPSRADRLPPWARP